MNPFHSSDPVGRRQFIVGALGIAGLVGVGSCGSDDDSPSATSATSAGSVPESAGSTPASSAPAGSAPASSTPASSTPESTTAITAAETVATEAAGEWSFTDDRGVTVTFERQPTRVVAWQAIVPALVELGITPVGVIAFNDLATNPAFIDAGVDVANLVPVSESYGEVDIEALAALQPDLILTYWLGDDILQGFTDLSTQDLAGQVAPFVALDSSAAVRVGIERMEELCVVLGADLDSEANRADAAAFETAVSDLSEVIADKPGLTAAFGGPSPMGFFAAPIASYPELQLYTELGLDVYNGPQDSVISWELVEDVAADVLFVDDRTTEAELAEAETIATWNTIPAVAADQVSLTWRFLLSYSRADYARTINRMLPALRGAATDVV